MTIVIAVAVGDVTVLVLAVVVLLILFRRRKPQQSHTIARAKAECAVQPTTADVVCYKNIGGGVARLSSASAIRRTSTAFRSDVSAAQHASGAEQFARTGASQDTHPDVYALPVRSGEVRDYRTRRCTPDSVLGGSRIGSTKQAGMEQSEKPLPYDLTRKNPTAIASTPTVPKGDMMPGRGDYQNQIVREVCPIEYQEDAGDYS